MESLRAVQVRDGRGSDAAQEGEGKAGDVAEGMEVLVRALQEMLEVGKADDAQQVEPAAETRNVAGFQKNGDLSLSRKHAGCAKASSVAVGEESAPVPKEPAEIVI